MAILRKFILAALLLIGVTSAWADTVYLSRIDFLNQAFAGDVPEAKTVWWVGDKKQRVQTALNAEPLSMRSRYWQQGERTAWI